MKNVNGHFRDTVCDYPSLAEGDWPSTTSAGEEPTAGEILVDTEETCSLPPPSVGQLLGELFGDVDCCCDEGVGLSSSEVFGSIVLSSVVSAGVFETSEDLGGRRPFPPLPVY